MNIAKVKNSADFVNYVKPGMEMVEMEVEGAILNNSTTRSSASISTTPGTFTPNTSLNGKVERRQ